MLEHPASILGHDEAQATIYALGRSDRHLDAKRQAIDGSTLAL
jgi:hypothetical protein